MCRGKNLEFASCERSNAYVLAEEDLELQRFQHVMTQEYMREAAAERAYYEGLFEEGERAAAAEMEYYAGLADEIAEHETSQRELQKSRQRHQRERKKERELRRAVIKRRQLRMTVRRGRHDGQGC